MFKDYNGLSASICSGDVIRTHLHANHLYGTGAPEGWNGFLVRHIWIASAIRAGRMRI